MTGPGDLYKQTKFSDLACLVVAGLAGILALVLVLLAPTLSPDASLITVVISAILAPLALAVLYWPRLVFYGYISLCMVFPTELDALHWDTGAVRVYGHDIMFGLSVVIIMARAVWGKVGFHEIWFNKQITVYLLLGIWATGIGLFYTGNDFSNVLGDFRRSFFYFLIYFLALAFTSDQSEIRYLKNALLFGSCAVIIRGLLQFIAGDFVARRIGDAAHIMNHFEITFTMFAIFYGIASLTVSEKKSFVWLLPVLCGSLIVVLGNFRTCWIGMAGGIAVVMVLLPFKYRLRTLGAVSAVTLSAALALALLWNYPVKETQSTVGQNIAQKANWRSAAYDTNVEWRKDSYRNAVALWMTQPLLGRGLGEQLEFYTGTSTGGSMLATGHRVHNSYLWLLMSLGIAGISVFLYVHGSYIWHVVYQIRSTRLSAEAYTVTLACLGFYSAIMISALFDVYLESSPPIMVLSVTMALSLLAIRYNTATKTPSHSVQDGSR